MKTNESEFQVDIIYYLYKRIPIYPRHRVYFEW